MSEKTIGQSYASFVEGFSWSHFVTVTLRRERSDPFAFVRDLWTTMAMSCGYDRAFIAIEKTSWDGSYKRMHCHALAHVPDVVASVFTPAEAWHPLFNRFGRSEVSPIRGVQAVSHYCSKYVLKNQCHYDFCGSSRSWDLTNSDKG